MLDGKLIQESGGGSVVSFQRRIDRPVDKVWAALTVPERLSDWLAEATIALEIGGRYELRFHGTDDVMTGRIIRLEPPHLLEYMWRENGGVESVVQWRLEPEGRGCRLSLTHTLPAGAPGILGFVSGWHQHLDAIPAACDGVATPWDPARWKALDDQYRPALAASLPADLDH